MQDHWSRLFAISRLSVCLIVQEICQLIMDVLMPKHIKKPEGNQLKEIVQVFERKWGFPQCVGAVAVLKHYTVVRIYSRVVSFAS